MVTGEKLNAERRRQHSHGDRGNDNRMILLAILTVLISGCVGIPDNIKPVQGFDVNRYLGTWYEVARLDNSFEKGLEQITAQYSLREDGGLRVLNRGYDPKKQHWEEAEGKAFFVGPPTEGRLKVSFFGPFYGSYNIISLDGNYAYSLVCSSDYSYLWILSRAPKLADTVLSQLVAKAKEFGFNTSNLIYLNK